MVHIQEWVNPSYLSLRRIHAFQKEFLNNKPFAHLSLHDFLRKDKAKLLFNELAKEQFIAKESDLFKLMQTYDFLGTKNKILKQFRDFLASDEFISFIEVLTGLSLKQDVVDVNGSLYQDTDYLLPHDDQLESRKIAFMIYFSDFTKKDGGALLLYDTKKNKPVSVAKKLYPQANTFTFFAVSTKSFHAVEEITSKKQRVSINGWFHG